MDRPTTKNRLLLNRPQREVLRATKKKRILIAGIGTGKSLVGGFFSLECSKVKHARGLVLASTYDQLRDATLPRMQEAWSMMGFHEEEHYVIGKRPPASWGIEPYSSLNNSNVVTFYWGSYIKLGSAEKYNAHRGPAYDWIYGDEVRDWREIGPAIKVLVGRLRGLAYLERGLLSPMLLTTSPLDLPEELSDFFAAEDIEIIRGTTLDNLKHLPSDYLATQQSTLDPLTYRREVLGEDVDFGGLRACWAFSAERYPLGNVVDAPFDPTAETWMDCDFNSGANRPMSWLLRQRQIVNGQAKDVIVHSFINLRIQTPAQCELVQDWLVERGFRGKLHIRGDQTGEHASRGSAATKSDYAWIDEHLKTGPRDPARRWTYIGKPPLRRTTRIKDRIAALNSRFCSMSGSRELLVDYRQTKVIEACTRLKFNEGGTDLDENVYNDPVAAASYGAYNDHPVHLKQQTTRQT